MVDNIIGWIIGALGLLSLPVAWLWKWKEDWGSQQERHTSLAEELSEVKKIIRTEVTDLRNEMDDLEQDSLRGRKAIHNKMDDFVKQAQIDRLESRVDRGFTELRKAQEAQTNRIINILRGRD